MPITVFETGSHILSQEDEISIKGKVVLFDTSEGPFARNIRLQESSELSYFSFTKEGSDLDVHFYQDRENSRLLVRSFFFSKGESHAKIAVDVLSSFTTADIELFWLAFATWNLYIDGMLSIAPWLRKVVGSIREKNVFLEDGGKIRGIPALRVASDDVQASHSCTVERLSEEARFYAESRGLSPETARELLLTGRIRSLYVSAGEEFTQKVLSSISF